MKITVSEQAQNWFIEELNLTSGSGIRFFGKYGGSTNVHSGFTTGMDIAQPSEDILGKTTEQEIIYFAETLDDWFFHGYDLEVGFDEKLGEPFYYYQAK